MNNIQSDLNFDQTDGRSPRHQHLLYRQHSRPFEAYSGIQAGNMYAPQDQTIRYDAGRFDRMNGPIGPSGYGNDMYQAQTWNPNAFNANSQIPSNYAATTRMRPNMRGRNPLPNVSKDSLSDV